MGSGCGTIGIQSSHRLLIYWKLYSKVENNEKRVLEWSKFKECAKSLGELHLDYICHITEFDHFANLLYLRSKFQCVTCWDWFKTYFKGWLTTSVWELSKIAGSSGSRPGQVMIKIGFPGTISVTWCSSPRRLAWTVKNSTPLV